MIFSKKTDAQLKHPLFKKFLFIWKHPALTLTLPAYFNAASALTTNSHVRCVDEILNSSFVVWILFILIQFTNPGIHSEGITEGIRIWILRTLMLYIVASIVSNTPKMLRNSLIVIGIFIIIAFLKVLYQKYVGFDFAEKRGYT